MEDTRKRTNRIGTRHFHLAHHIDNDSPCLPYRGLDAATVVARTKRSPYLFIGRCHRHTADSNRTIARNGHRSFWRNGQCLGLLRGTINLNDHLIACPYGVIRGSCDVHIGLKAQQFVVEYIATKHFLASRREYLLGTFINVGLHFHVLLLCCFLRSLVRYHVPRRQILLVRAVIIAQNTGRRSRSCIASHCLILALVLASDAPYLVYLHATLHEFGHNLTVGGPCFVLSLIELHHLAVCHLGKTAERNHGEKQTKERSFHKFILSQ